MSTAPTATGALAPTQIHRLENGLTLLMRENHDVAVATTDVWIRTGSADEPPEISGISHFLEHMLFKGTERFALGEIEREIENAGGVCNAGTSYDFTHYFVTLPSANVARGIEMLGEMVCGSTLDAGEMEKERLVILEEYRRKQDDPEGLLYDDVYEQLFETGPYHRSVIGSEETIRSISRDQMAQYYERHYAPSNMTLVVNGDIDPGDVIARVESVFGALDRAYDPLVTRPEPTRLARAKQFHREKSTGGEVYFSLLCGAPGVDDIDALVTLDVARYILGQGRASLLYQEIKERRRLASTIACYHPSHRQTSLFMIDATVEPEKQPALRQAIDELIERFANEPISHDQLNRARRLLVSGHLFSFETTGSVSVQTGYYYTMTGGTDFLDTYLERLDAVTDQQVQAAFARMLDAYEWVEVSVGPRAESAKAASPAESK